MAIERSITVGGRLLIVTGTGNYGDLNILRMGQPAPPFVPQSESVTVHDGETLLFSGEIPVGWESWPDAMLIARIRHEIACLE